MKNFFPLGIFIIINLCSCASFVSNTFGNQIIDSHYSPNPQIEPFYTEIPYEINNELIVVPVKFNNSSEEYKFIFDTGATTMITMDLANKLNLTNGITSVSKDINGNDVVGFSYLTNLNLGTLAINNIRINSFELEKFSKKCGDKFDGIIGANVLKQGYFFFDSNQKKLIITNQIIKLPMDRFDKPIRLKRFMGQPYIAVTGNSTDWLLFDTGYADGSILIPLKTKILNKTDSCLKQTTSFVRGLTSEKLTNASFFNRNIKIGKTENSMTLMQIDKKSGRGSVGNKIIQDNDIIIDASHKKFYLEKEHHPLTIYSIPNLSFIFKNDRIVIGSLTKGGGIEKMGIMINDTICKINSKSVDGIKSDCEFKDFKKKNILNIFPLLIEVEKNKTRKTFTITKKEFYE